MLCLLCLAVAMMLCSLIPSSQAALTRVQLGRRHKAAIASVASLLSSTLPSTAYAVQCAGSSSVILSAEGSSMDLGVSSTSTSTRSSSSSTSRKEGSVILEGESLRMFRRARMYESDGELIEAQKLYEELLKTEPDYIYSWSNLANVLVARGFLAESLLCYKKALLLSPPAETLPTILVNKATVEIALGDISGALRDLDIAEKVAGPLDEILTNRGVAYSNEAKWDKAIDQFEKVLLSPITGGRFALPWWLRYSQCLLEVGREQEAETFLQRTIQRYGDEVECKVFGAALYYKIGNSEESRNYWLQVSDTDRAYYSTDVDSLLQKKLKWGPIGVASFKAFLSSKTGRL